MNIDFDIKLEAVILDNFLIYYYKKENRKLIESQNRLSMSRINYRIYLYDPNLNIPRSTLYKRRLRKEKKNV
jgi:hypothetical protein